MTSAPHAARSESTNWLELFFDLVVVAAVGVLTEGLLEDVTWSRVGLTVVVYVSIWLAWSTAVLYVNVVREQTRFWTLTIAMFLLAVMTVSAPLHGEHRANLFAAAFVVVRAVVGRSANSTGRVLGSWPMLQLGSMSALWLASLFVPAPVKYWVWAVALVLDFLFVVLRGDKLTDEMVAAMQQRLTRQRHSREVELVAVDIDHEHLDERLGLFVIIVPGEAVIQVVHAAAGATWTGSFELATAGAFVLLLGIWRLTFAHGFTGAPARQVLSLPPRFGLPLHLVSTGGLVFVAAGLAGALRHTDRHVEPAVCWLLAGGLTAYFGVGLVAGLAGDSPRRWLAVAALPSTAYAVGLGLAGTHVSAAALTWLAALPAVWQSLAQLGSRRPDDR